MSGAPAGTPAAGVHVWLFDGGTFDVPADLMVAGATGPAVRIPSVWAAVRHRSGVLVVDTGAAEPAVSGCVERPYPVAAGLAAVGIGADEVRFIVNTHLHVDHCAGNAELPEATAIVQRRELEYALDPTDASMIPEYDAALVAPGSVTYDPVDGEVDLFGDGAVRLVPTPGHSPGHQSVLLTLERGGRLLLAGDAIWTAACRSRDVRPGLLWSADAYERSRALLLDLADQSSSGWVHAHEPATFAAGGWPQAGLVR